MILHTLQYFFLYWGRLLRGITERAKHKQDLILGMQGEWKALKNKFRKADVNSNIFFNIFFFGNLWLSILCLGYVSLNWWWQWQKKTNVWDGMSGTFTTETWTEKILNKWFRWNLDNILWKSQKQLLHVKRLLEGYITGKWIYNSIFLTLWARVTFKRLKETQTAKASQ